MVPSHFHTESKRDREKECVRACEIHFIRSENNFLIENMN